jgi:hypothetical protein
LVSIFLLSCKITFVKELDLARLGPMVVELARNFEDVMTNIRNQHRDDQVKLLTGYKKLLEE